MWRQLLFLFVGIGMSMSAISQPVLTPKNMGLGGGGTTYLTDYHANFYNPANLLINDNTNNLDIGIGGTTSFFNGVVNFENPDDQKDNLFDYFSKFEPGNYQASSSDINQILDIHYRRDRLTSIHQSRFETSLFGINWIKNEKAFSISARSRVGSTIEVGRNWYSDQPVEIDDIFYSNQDLVHRYQILHEISFGYSESANLINGLSSRLDNFLIGIAPKFILAGPYQQAIWRNQYQQVEGNAEISRTQSFEYQTAGNFTASTLSYLNGSSANDAVVNNFDSFQDELSNVYGYGVGLDFGFTYLLTFGDDLSTLLDNRQTTDRSIRISLSVNDIGFINYNDKTLTVEEVNTNSNASGFPTSVNEAFIGAPGQFLAFTDEHGDGNPVNDNQSASNEDSFNALLPASFSGGILLELRRFKLMGDLNIGISNSAFTTTKLTTSLGTEIRALKFLPLRGGLQFTPGLPGSFNIGAGIETKYWDLSLSMMVSARSFTTENHISGAGLAVLQFHL